MKQETKLKPQLNKKVLPEFIKARNNYFLAKALNETNINIDNEAKQEVLNENVFVFGRGSICQEKGKRINKPSLDYNLNDVDFKRYCKLVLKKREAKGLILPYAKYEHSIKELWNLTADCESRPLLREAEKVLISASLDILPEPLKTQFKSIDLIQNYTHLQKYLKLVLSLDVGDNPTSKEILKGCYEC